jgi:chemotaxis protein CheY-P-specific phosphatase CheC
MKALFTSLLLGSFMLLSAFTLQKSSIDEVIAALRSGNSTQLSNFFDDNVELTLPDKSDSYSKAQAQLIVKDFFGNNGVKGFELKHKGDSPGGHFCIGTLQTNAGNFRTNVFMKIKNGKEVVKEIRFQSIE